MNKKIRDLIIKITKLKKKPVEELTEDEKLSLKVLLSELRYLLYEKLKKFVENLQIKLKNEKKEEQEEEENEENEEKKLIELITILLTFYTFNSNEFGEILEKILFLTEPKNTPKIKIN